MKAAIYLIIGAVMALAAQGCKKADTVYEDPYANPKPPLDIKLERNIAPSPASGIAGTTVHFTASGLMDYKDKLVFMFNGEKAEVTSITAMGIDVKVPAAASSGITSISVDDQLVIGPAFAVLGLIKIDPTFRAVAGANNTVSQVYPLADGRDLILGFFTNYDNKGFVAPLNRIVRTSGDGELDRTFRTGKAANGGLSNIIELGGKFIIAGGFNGYDQRTENISNITALNVNGTIDTMGVKTYRRPSQTDTTQFFPKFNGGTTDFIDRLYVHENKILATGNFRYYVRRTYTDPNATFTRDTVKLDSTEIRQIVRFNADGTMDSSFRFNMATGKGLPAANGPILSYMHTEPENLEKLVIFGNFTTFDQQAAGRIVRLNVDGSIDNSFHPGGGADNFIFSLTYNTITKRYLITGAFQHYGGRPAPGIALLNEDGSLDETFAGKVFDGGYPQFARQLKDGLVVVSGAFKKYNNVTRNGFMVLTPTGDFAPGYNATGIFSGGLSDILETQSADGKRALLLIGSFNRFDNQQVYNITRVTLE
jgi:hypothetical protein